MKRVILWLKHLYLNWRIAHMTPAQRLELNRRMMFEHTRKYGAMRPLLPRRVDMKFPTRYT